MMIQGGARSLPMSGQQMTQRIHQKIDADQDGSISKQEMKAVADKQQQRTGQAPKMDIDAVFDKLDTDGTAGLSVEEFGTLTGQIQDKMADRIGQIRSQMAGGISQIASAPSTQEVSDLSEQMVSDPADADQDGEVTAEERRAYAAEQAGPSSAGQQMIRAYAAEEETTTSVLAAA
ncbi:MAG: EF-hand domain-containing protein [Myxococcota bacterium]